MSISTKSCLSEGAVPDLRDGICICPHSPVEDAAHLGSATLLALTEQHKGGVLLQHTPPASVTQPVVYLWW